MGIAFTLSMFLYFSFPFILIPGVNCPTNKLTRMQIPLRSICTGYLRRYVFNNKGKYMSSREYSGESIKIENLATCFKALIGIIDPKDVAFAEEFHSDQTFHETGDVRQIIS